MSVRNWTDLSRQNQITYSIGEDFFNLVSSAGVSYRFFLYSLSLSRVLDRNLSDFIFLPFVVVVSTRHMSSSSSSSSSSCSSSSSSLFRVYRFLFFMLMVDEAYGGGEAGGDFGGRNCGNRKPAPRRTRGLPLHRGILG